MLEATGIFFHLTGAYSKDILQEFLGKPMTANNILPRLPAGFCEFVSAFKRLNQVE
jgi:hypothetical protein